MTDITTNFHRQALEAHENLKQEAATLAQYPEMVNGLLILILDEDETIRYDAAQMLTLLPETTPNYEAVRDALTTAFHREESPEILFLLAQKIGRFAQEKDKNAFHALQEGAQSAENAVVCHWCLSSLAEVHPDFAADAMLFLENLRDTQTNYRADIFILESLAALKHRSQKHETSGEDKEEAVVKATLHASGSGMSTATRRWAIIALGQANVYATLLGSANCLHTDLLEMYEDMSRLTRLYSSNLRAKSKASYVASAVASAHDHCARGLQHILAFELENAYDAFAVTRDAVRLLHAIAPELESCPQDLRIFHCMAIVWQLLEQATGTGVSDDGSDVHGGSGKRVRPIDRIAQNDPRTGLAIFANRKATR